MDSEGLLALPVLRDVRGVRVGVVTAPGGRDRVVPALAQAGAHVVRADVYRREPLPPTPRAVAALRALDAPAWLALSSGEALAHLLATLPADTVTILRRARVVAASERLADLAKAKGFTRVVRAAGPRPRDLVAAVQAP
jgi:uroporphyrinogen-III synthase